MAEKQSIDSLIKEINKNFGDDVLHLGELSYEYKRIPFTSPRLNYVTYGGIPLGKLVEFYGAEHGGKTTSALDIAANYQHMENPKGILYVDVENTLDKVWATKLGVDFTIPKGEPGCVYIMSPTDQGAETLFEVITKMIETDQIGLVVIDSLGAMLSNQELGKTIEDKTYGGISMALTRFSKEAVGLCGKHECTVLGINQERDDMNSPYGGKTTPGGKAWKYNCSVRLEFRHGRFFDDKYKDLSNRADNPIGNYVECYMAKNKTCPPDRHNGFYTLKYATGIDYLYDLIEVCIEYGFIAKRGAWFDIIDPETGEILKQSIQGQSNVTEFLKQEENMEILMTLEKALESKIAFQG